MEIKCNISDGYLKDPKFTFYLYQTIEKITKGLKNVDKLTVNLIETFPYLGHTSTTPPLEYSEDGKQCTINITSYRERGKKGKHTEVPSPSSVYRPLKFVLEKLVKEHPVKFPIKKDEEND